MFLEKYSLLYCWIHKAASSSWNRVFFEMSNMAVPEDDFLHAANHIFRPRDSVSRQHLFDNAAVSFAFVRQPFERLVSAYRDKFELANMDDWFFKIYAADIFSLPDSAYFKLRNVLWPAEFTFDDNSDPASARDWHPRVSETSLTNRT